MSRYIPAPLLCTSLIFLTGCTSGNPEEPERAYVIPTQLCGTEIAAEDYGDLFPPGDAVETDGYTEEGSPENSCTVRVDGEKAFTLTSTHARNSHDVEEYINERGYILDIQESTAFDAGKYEIKAWSNIAVGFSPCATSQFDDTGVGYIISTNWGGDRDHSASLGSAMQSYIETRATQIDSSFCEIA